MSTIAPLGRNCGQHTGFVCHKDIRFRITDTTARACNDGQFEDMLAPIDFVSPRKDYKICLFQVLLPNYIENLK